MQECEKNIRESVDYFKSLYLCGLWFLAIVDKGGFQPFQASGAFDLSVKRDLLLLEEDNIPIGIVKSGH